MTSGGCRESLAPHSRTPLSSPQIIHRDIKPPNILIDDDLESRVADFGLAETIDLDEHTHLSTSVSGTVGYLAPEYSAQGKLTTKSDVYAFGVVILQVRGMGGECVWYLRIYIHVRIH